MKIKTQITMLIMAIIVLPALCLASLPIYHFFTSYQRYLEKSFRQMQKMNDLDLTEDEWELFKQKMQEIPPNVESAVYFKGKILFSTIKDLKEGTEISYSDFFAYIWQTSEDYSYQFQAPLKPVQAGAKNKGNVTSLVLVTRNRVSWAQVNRFNRILLPAFCILVLFVILGVTIIVRLSHTISQSILILEESTEKIANGELDTIIEHTAKRRQANEITSLTENLEKMRLSLKDNEERRTRFIMGISHDLRTPIALIKGYAEAITDGVVSDHDQIIKSLTIVEAKADQLENMTNDLINYVKLNNTEWRHTLEPVALEPYLKEFSSSAIMTGDVNKRNITADINIDPEIKVPMDRALFERALENLVSNAIRYSSEGDSIKISASNSDSEIKISISDTGKGIAKEDVEHIYELFYRGTSSRREQGMGIGLSVVKTIIDTHGWKIDVESRLNEGTCFTITIPV